MPATERQTTAENERVAATLSGRRIAGIHYFLLSVDNRDSWQWDFGVWHAPTMGVELHTGTVRRSPRSGVSTSSGGFGVDLFLLPMRAHLTEEAADSWVDATQHPLWSPILGTPIEVGFRWNDFGTGRPPCPEAVTLTTRSEALWIIAAEAERQGSTLSFHLGLDDLMVVFDKKFVRALGLCDPFRGWDRSEGPRATS